LLLDEELTFLDDNKGDIRDRAMKFVSYIKKTSNSLDRSGDSGETFNAYIKSWEIHKQGKWKDEDIERAITLMKKERCDAVVQNTNAKYLDKIVSELSVLFEPLREELKPGRITESYVNQSYFWKVANDFTWGLVEKAMEAVIPFAAQYYGDRRLQEGWFDNTRKEIIQYIRGQKTDEDLRRFLKAEDLEKERNHFVEVLYPWINKQVIKNKDILQAVQSFKYEAFYLPKEPMMLEIDRMSKFLCAAMLNKPDMLKDHQDLMKEAIKAAATAPAPIGWKCVIPFVSFGQLPLANGLAKRVVLLELVLDQSKTNTEMLDVVRTIKKLFKKTNKCELVKENGIKIIKLQIAIEDNVATLVANSISKLSDLSIRGILVGNFGLDGFRQAMNPRFNRIYSVSFQETEGFISTFFAKNIDRGGEPYFCPTGWRRYAIYVGITDEEFELSYRNWPVAYHGTKGHLATAILLTGLQASGQGCFLPRDGSVGAVYLSPSIEYCGHPRYAGVWKIKDKYVQMVLQVRVENKLIFEKCRGTLSGASHVDAPMDPNFNDNMELEWIIRWPPKKYVTSNDGIIVYGLMMRVTDVHPSSLPSNKWWGPKWSE